MEKPPSLTRTCLACGLEKPLAAFLQITGTQGTVYGNICSTCRSSVTRSKTIIAKPEEEDSGGSGLKIDSKTKIQRELEQKLLAKKTKELSLEEKKLTENLEQDKTERKETREKAEKEHRIGFIEAKKTQGFLGQKPASDKIKRQSTSPDGNLPSGTQDAIEAKKLEDAILQEIKLTTIDTSQMYLDSQFGELKFQSEIFKRFKDLLGTGAHFRTIERLYKKTADQAQKQTDSKLSTEKNKTSKEKDPFTDYVENSFKPSSRSSK